MFIYHFSDFIIFNIILYNIIIFIYHTFRKCGNDLCNIGNIIKYKKYYFWFLTHIEKCGIPQNDVVEYNMPGLEDENSFF